MRTGKRSPGWLVLAIIAVCGLSFAVAAVLMARAQRSHVVDATESAPQTGAQRSQVVDATKPAAQNQSVTIAIEGMHCDGCATGIKAMLRRATGVVSADVSYKRKEAVIGYDPGRVTREEILQAIANMGYRVSLKE